MRKFDQMILDRCNYLGRLIEETPEGPEQLSRIGALKQECLWLQAIQQAEQECRSDEFGDIRSAIDECQEDVLKSTQRLVCKMTWAAIIAAMFGYCLGYWGAS